jgi:hypothetical protein
MPRRPDATMKAQMNYQQRLGLVLILVTAAVPAKVHAAVERVDISRKAGTVAVLRTSELRSAYLVRAGVVHYDSADFSPRGIQHQLRRHFDVVLTLLMTATPTSIDAALNRLERSCAIIGRRPSGGVTPSIF